MDACLINIFDFFNEGLIFFLLLFEGWGSETKVIGEE
jgi:hypothetical protein